MGVASLDTPLVDVLGQATARTLARALALRTAGDLLRHLPRRYAERGELTDLAGLEEGRAVTVQARVAEVRTVPFRGRRGTRTVAVISDGARQVELTWFNAAWRARQLRVGSTGLFSGTVNLYRGKPQLTHPDFVMLDDPADVSGGGDFAGALLPVYPLAAGVQTWHLTRAVTAVLDVLEEPEDPLPVQVRARHGLVGLGRALRLVHRPETAQDHRVARHRLVWDEALLLQAVLARRRHDASQLLGTARQVGEGLTGGGLLDAFDAALPFALTDGQRVVAGQIGADLARPVPMNRLLQGDVGTGKTLVALRAMLAVVQAGGQAALLAPTEVLAAQHARSIAALLGPLGRAGELDGDPDGTRVALLHGGLTAAQRRAALADVADGRAGVVVGTHALLEESVRFHDLGLVVVDEQHRFGVEQRDRLRHRDGAPPHVLVMTATPIPRTVAMTVYGDLDVSTLRELPHGRRRVASHVVPPERPEFLARAWRRVHEEVGQGRRAYVVCPRIGGDEADAHDGSPHDGLPDAGALLPDGDGDGVRRPDRPPLAVLDVVEELAAGPLAGLRLAPLHGRLPPGEKDEVLRRLAVGDLDVVVATTVVEVGVDVPTASTMVVLDADRFGVSQLHQLRGRVGRAGEEGLCLLVTQAPAGTAARERLDAVAATSDGFALARLDLEQRREGDVLGAAQSGRRSRLRLLSLLHHEDVIREARQEAQALVADDPGLADHPALAAAVEAALEEERSEFLEKG